MLQLNIAVSLDGFSVQALKLSGVSVHPMEALNLCGRQRRLRWHMIARFFVLLAGLAAVPWAGAGLEFEKPVQSAEVKISDAEIGTKFAFKVTGDKPVRITDIRTFCSCVRAQTLDGKMVFQPGESGVIDTAFEVGSFEGELKKEVVVTTDDAAHPETRLVLEVKIPGMFELTPAQLVWQVGEAPAPKTVRIRVLGDDPVRVTGAVSSRETMTTGIREVAAGKEYEITVTPAATDTKVLGLVRVETDSKYPRYQKRLVFFNITDKKPMPTIPAPAK